MVFRRSLASPAAWRAGMPAAVVHDVPVDLVGDHHEVVRRGHRAPNASSSASRPTLPLGLPGVQSTTARPGDRALECRRVEGPRGRRRRHEHRDPSRGPPPCCSGSRGRGSKPTTFVAGSRQREARAANPPVAPSVTTTSSHRVDGEPVVLREARHDGLAQRGDPRAARGPCRRRSRRARRPRGRASAGRDVPRLMPPTASQAWVIARMSETAALARRFPMRMGADSITSARGWRGPTFWDGIAAWPRLLPARAPCWWCWPRARRARRRPLARRPQTRRRRRIVAGDLATDTAPGLDAGGRRLRRRPCGDRPRRRAAPMDAAADRPGDVLATAPTCSRRPLTGGRCPTLSPSSPTRRSRSAPSAGSCEMEGCTASRATGGCLASPYHAQRRRGRPLPRRAHRRGPPVAMFGTAPATGTTTCGAATPTTGSSRRTGRGGLRPSSRSACSTPGAMGMGTDIPADMRVQLRQPGDPRGLDGHHGRGPRPPAMIDITTVPPGRYASARRSTSTAWWPRATTPTTRASTTSTSRRRPRPTAACPTAGSTDPTLACPGATEGLNPQLRLDGGGLTAPARRARASSSAATRAARPPSACAGDPMLACAGQHPLHRPHRDRLQRRLLPAGRRRPTQLCSRGVHLPSIGLHDPVGLLPRGRRGPAVLLVTLTLALALLASPRPENFAAAPRNLAPIDVAPAAAERTFSRGCVQVMEGCAGPVRPSCFQPLDHQHGLGRPRRRRDDTRWRPAAEADLRALPRPFPLQGLRRPTSSSRWTGAKVGPRYSKTFCLEDTDRHSLPAAVVADRDHFTTRRRAVHVRSDGRSPRSTLSTSTADRASPGALPPARCRQRRATHRGTRSRRPTSPARVVDIPAATPTRARTPRRGTRRQSIRRCPCALTGTLGRAP